MLEYYKTKSLDIVRNISNLLNPGGILCLVDLDYNCLSHYGPSQKLERTIQSIMECLERETDFDPYMGRKLYSFFYDLGYKDIVADVSSHHLIIGKLNEIDAFNWQKKIKIASGKIGYKFEEYEGGYEEFNNEFKAFFR